MQTFKYLVERNDKKDDKDSNDNDNQSLCVLKHPAHPVILTLHPSSITLALPFPSLPFPSLPFPSTLEPRARWKEVDLCLAELLHFDLVLPGAGHTVFFKPPDLFLGGGGGGEEKYYGNIVNKS